MALCHLVFASSARASLRLCADGAPIESSREKFETPIPRFRGDWLRRPADVALLQRTEQDWLKGSHTEGSICMRDGVWGERESGRRRSTSVVRTRVAEQTPEGTTKSVTYRPKISGPTTNVIYLVTYFFWGIHVTRSRTNFLAATRRRVAAIQTNCTLILLMAFNLWMMATANQSNDPSVLVESGHPDRGTMKWASSTCLTRWSMNSMDGGKTSDTSLHTSLSAVLTALRHLEELHNWRFGPQTSAGSGEAQRDVFHAPIGLATGSEQDMPEISAICETLSRFSGSVHFQTHPLPLMGTETEQNDKAALHVFGGGAAKSGDEEQDHIQFQDYDFFVNWVELQVSSSWIPERSTVGRDISSWLFSSNICQTVLPEYQEFRPQSTSTPRRREVGAACTQCGTKYYDLKPRSRLRIHRQPRMENVAINIMEVAVAGEKAKRD
ncbi:hypothetical protein B0H13DRAFT_1885850 [Mycena leptocephala]|nr:hypothetical protein B0H13DRAFT_1885850 [Mycena leptocephala]